MKAIGKKELSSGIGIGHTRWATHGEPNDANAHPHWDCHKEIAIIHNGIIENYATLKRKLEHDGHVIRTVTDTEVLVHLIEENVQTVARSFYRRSSGLTGSRRSIRHPGGSFRRKSRIRLLRPEKEVRWSLVLVRMKI